MHRALLPGLVALVLVTAACGGGATPAPSGPAVSPLPAGTYTSQAFRPQVTYTVPDGWEAPPDAATYFQLRPAGSEVLGIHLFRDPVAASQAEACPVTPEPGVGTTSTQLVEWFRSRPGQVVGTPALVTVGGLPGVSVDIGIAEGWTASCPFANGNPTVPLIVGRNGEYRWIIVGNERLRMDLLDLPGGGLVIVDIDAFDGTQIEGLLAAAAPIVKSFVFAPVVPPASGVASPSAGSAAP